MLYYLADNEQDGERFVQKLNELLHYKECYTSVCKSHIHAEHHVLVRFEEKYLSLLNNTEQSKVLKELPNSFIV